MQWEWLFLRNRKIFKVDTGVSRLIRMTVMPYSKVGLGASALLGYVTGSVMGSIGGSIRSLAIPTSVRSYIGNIDTRLRHIFARPINDSRMSNDSDRIVLATLPDSMYDKVRASVHESTAFLVGAGTHVAAVTVMVNGLTQAEELGSLVAGLLLASTNAISAGHEVWRAGRKSAREEISLEREFGA
jgi:hypothetical protein